MSTSRRSFLFTGAAAASAAAAPQTASAQDAEWKNRQSGMHYRRLGRTNLMISEVVSGGDPIRSDNWEHLGLALDMGLNYLDMAPQYGQGDCETAYGKFLGGSSAKRDKVFLTTKVSGYTGVRNQMYQEIFDGLGPAKQEAYKKKASDLLAERGAAKPGYFFEYFPGQMRGLEAGYLSNAMMPDYGHRVEGSRKFVEHIESSVEGSLQRLGVDYIDNLMCPHGAGAPEEIEHPQIIEECIKLDWEFMGHNQSNSRTFNEVPDADQRQVVLDTFSRINEATGSPPKGWLGAGLAENWNTRLVRCGQVKPSNFP